MEEVPLEKLKTLLEFDNHEKVVRLEDPSVGLVGYIAIHRIHPKYPALGATRLWGYVSEEDALRDALRLAQLMTYKSLLAGLPYTGAKAALFITPKILESQENRDAFFRAYAREVNKLEGKFVTGTDVGVSNDDLTIMSKESPHMIGHGVDSGYFTALGVKAGIEVALQKVFGSSDLSKRTFAIQGLGKTGLSLLKLLYKESFKIFVADVDPKTVSYVKFHFPNVEVVDSTVIHAQDVDVFSPCALSHSLTEVTVPELRCAIVAGSANNQLETKEVGELLRKRGILYAPDFVINAIGLISVVDQFENGSYFSKNRILKKIDDIRSSLGSIFDASRAEHKATNIVAGEIGKQRLDDLFRF